MYRAALFLLLGFLTACSNGGGSSQVATAEGERVFEVNHYRNACQGEGTFMCMLTKEQGTESWEFFYDGIVGFDFRWGHSYKLLVEEHPVADPPADGSSIEYRLKQVLMTREAPAGEEFEVSILNTHHLLEKQSPTTYRLSSDKAFTCHRELCDSIDAIMAQQMSMLAVFTHRDDKNAPLILQRILCSDSGGAYYSSCYGSD